MEAIVSSSTLTSRDEVRHRTNERVTMGRIRTTSLRSISCLFSVSFDELSKYFDSFVKRNRLRTIVQKASHLCVNAIIDLTLQGRRRDAWGQLHRVRSEP